MSEARQYTRTESLPSILLIFAAFVTGFVLAFAIGAIAYWLNNRIVDIAPIIAEDPAFEGVRIDDSANDIVLWGTVPTEADKTRLRSAVLKALGERRTSVVFHVYVDTYP
jgi:hypothetical protein